MLKQTRLCLWVGALAAAACGSPNDNDFSGPAAAGGHAASGGSSGSSGSKASGGSSGAAAAAGRGGSGTGGSGATGGTATGGSDIGDTGGSDMGGTDATGGTATGGSDIGGTGGSDVGGAGTGGSAGGALGGSSGDATTGGAGMGGADMGGAGSGKGGKAGNGGSAGAPNCDELTIAYAAALTEAKVCNASSGKDQCTEVAPSSLSCGCDQFVNPDNKDAVAELTRLRKQAGTHCATVCPQVLCVAPTQGTCESDSGDGGDGHCVTGSAVLQ